jgi:hypothetical protein
VPLDRPAYIAVACYAPWAFLTTEAFFIVVAVVTALEGTVDWHAVVVAIALLPGVVVTLMLRQLVKELLSEADERSRGVTARH